MSCKSVLSISMMSGGGSYRQNSIHEKLHSTSSAEEKIKFAGDESKDRLYEPKQNKKMVRVLTVIIYVFSVSLAAIMLSLYYGFFWKANTPTRKPQVADNVTSNKTTCVCLENHDGHSHSVVEASTFPFQVDKVFSNLSTMDGEDSGSSNTILDASNFNYTDVSTTSSPVTASEESGGIFETKSNSILVNKMINVIRSHKSDEEWEYIGGAIEV